MSSDTPASTPGNGDARTRLRAGDRAREAAVRGLQKAFDEGQIDYAELQERSDEALHAKYQDELTSLFLDLHLDGMPHASDQRFLPALMRGADGGTPKPQGKEASPHPAAPNRPVFAHQPHPMPMRYAPAGAGDSWSLSLFGGVEKRGSWICARQHTAFTAFGGIDLDFTQAQITEPRTTVEVVCLFGGIDIIVPDNYRVELKVLPIFGGSELKNDKRATIAQQQLPPDAPTIVVTGFCAFGGVDVTRVPRIY